MLTSLLLFTSVLAVTPTVTTPTVDSRNLYSCPQYGGAYGMDEEVVNILNRYDGRAMSLDFDTTNSSVYNPLQNNPYQNSTYYHFYIDFKLDDYALTYYIMSFDGGTNWQQVPITDNDYGLNLYCTYSHLEDVWIMYEINQGHDVEFFIYDWQVTFWTDSAFEDITTDEYQNGYNTGYQDGYYNGNENGYDNGKAVGYNIGFSEGSNSDLTTNGFRTMLNTIVSYPVNFLKTAFNFEIFGINISALIMFILSCGIVLWVINKFRK